MTGLLQEVDSRRLFVIAGSSSFAIALFHVICAYVGAPAYRYFGAGEGMVRMAQAGSVLPTLVTLGIAAAFTVFGLYAWAGAGRYRRPPLLRTGLLAIGVLYMLRGLTIFRDVAAYLRGHAEPRWIVFSLVTLAVGLTYLVATGAGWRELRADDRTGGGG